MIPLLFFHRPGPPLLPPLKDHALAADEGHRHLVTLAGTQRITPSRLHVRRAHLLQRQRNRGVPVDQLKGGEQPNWTAALPADCASPPSWNFVRARRHGGVKVLLLRLTVLNLLCKCRGSGISGLLTEIYLISACLKYLQGRTIKGSSRMQPGG